MKGPSISIKSPGCKHTKIERAFYTEPIYTNIQSQQSFLIMTFDTDVSIDLVPNGRDTAAPEATEPVVDSVPKSDESNRTGTSSDANSNSDTEKMTKWYCSIKLYVGLLLLGLIVYIIIDSVTNKYIRDGLVTFLDWIEENPAGGFFLFVIGTCDPSSCICVVPFHHVYSLIFSSSKQTQHNNNCSIYCRDSIIYTR